MIPPLSDVEILKVRKMIAWYDRKCEQEEMDARIEEELSTVSTRGDDWGDI